MKLWHMPKPCAGCPFLRDAEGVTPVRLRSSRIVEILGHVAPADHRGGSFPCHKTVDHDDRDPQTEKACTGALILMYKLGASTQLSRIMERLGGIDPELAEGDHPEVFDSVEEMLDTAIDNEPRGRTCRTNETKPPKPRRSKRRRSPTRNATD